MSSRWGTNATVRRRRARSSPARGGPARRRRGTASSCRRRWGPAAPPWRRGELEADVLQREAPAERTRQVAAPAIAPTVSLLPRRGWRSALHGAVDDDLVRADRVAQAGGEALQVALEPLVLEGRHPAAGVADGVMVVLAARQDRLVALAAVAKVDPLHQTHPVQQVERPVDARQAHLGAVGAQALGDLLGREAAALAREQLDHGAAGAAGAVPGVPQGPVRRSRPTRLCPRSATGRAYPRTEIDSR